MTRQHRDRAPEGITRDPSQRGTPLIVERAAYFALVNQGIGSREAARQVGVNYRTAKYWRATAKAAAVAAVSPVQPVAISTQYLSLHERIVIADRVCQPGMSLRGIATELGRPLSTITITGVCTFTYWPGLTMRSFTWPAKGARMTVSRSFLSASATEAVRWAAWARSVITFCTAMS